MAAVHLLNTHPGDCTIIRHNSGRVSMIDICDGNQIVFPFERPAHNPVRHGQANNFRMCGNTTNPIAYAQDLGIDSIFRFILTHPDMDHMDGFNKLANTLPLANYWDTGSRREKPNFANCPFLEVDWDRYERVRDGREPGVSSGLRRAGDKFAFANRNEDGTGGGDGLNVLAPDAGLVADCNMTDDVNDGSYVFLYRSNGGRILLPGDAHDNTWQFIRRNYLSDVADASFLLAPHHGRDSERSYDFLDYVRPQLTLFGCAPSEHVDCDQWRRRGLDYITSNQCGNVVLQPASDEFGTYIAVYVQNVDFAVSRGQGTVTNEQGYAYLTTIWAVAEAAA
jgi:competence protein ComEC